MSKLDEMLEKISRAAGTGQLRVEKIVGCGDMDDLMVALGGQENERHKYNEITPETLSDLKALGQKYVDSLSKLPFALGDLVTSRKSGSDKFHGQPMVVIDTNPVTAPIGQGVLPSPDPIGQASNSRDDMTTSDDPTAIQRQMTQRQYNAR